LSKKKKTEKRKSWLKNLFDHITLRKKTHSFRSLLTPHLPGAESSKAFSRTHLLWQTTRKTCSRMLRQTRRKTITIEVAPTFPEQNLASSRSRRLRQTTRTRHFNGQILLVLQNGYIKKFLKKDKENLAKSSY
jgi:hypothetical protein